ncbi:MAG: carboxyl-terminal processing protease [Chloroflexota bacterium]|jgi:carboxyl-terminal processing protease|nr:carboxyl-terminal processing protease [Chloroflexota bacterium]
MIDPTDPFARSGELRPGESRPGQRPEWRPLPALPHGWVASPPVVTPPPPNPAPRLAALLVSLLLVFVVGFAAGDAIHVEPIAVFPGTTEPTAQPPGGSPVAGATVPPDAPSDIGVFWEALKVVKDNFVDPSKLTDQNLTWGAIRGMVDALGDTGHSTFLTPEQVTAQQDSLNGRVSGVGIVVDSRTPPPVIVSVIPGSPAAAAGLRAGDVILAVDGTATDTLQSNDVVQRIRGAPGTTVVLTVRHPGDTATTDVSVVRADIAVPVSTWAMVPGTTVADIHVIQFSTGAADTAKQQLQAALAAGATKVVLDLRGNPGGYVPEAINLASQFIADGIVYEERDRSGNVKPVRSVPGGVATEAPLVVLVDSGSASASEIVAGAIQGNQRGELVGEKTFGTGTVLNTFELSDHSAILLGVLEWLTPTGETIFGKGITPDVVVTLPADGTLVEPSQLETMSPADFTASKDTQLQKAVELLGP